MTVLFLVLFALFQNQAVAQVVAQAVDPGLVGSAAAAVGTPFIVPIFICSRQTTDPALCFKKFPALGSGTVFSGKKAFRPHIAFGSDLWGNHHPHFFLLFWEHGISNEKTWFIKITLRSKTNNSF